jgi:hypothetical protein
MLTTRIDRTQFPRQRRSAVNSRLDLAPAACGNRSANRKCALHRKTRSQLEQTCNRLPLAQDPTPSTFQIHAALSGAALQSKALGSHRLLRRHPGLFPLHDVKFNRRLSLTAELVLFKHGQDLVEPVGIEPTTSSLQS